MTEGATNKSSAKEQIHPYKKLSIQVGLNGLSFCVLDTIAHKVLLTDTVDFKVPATPYLLLKALKQVIEKHELNNHQFAAVNVIHNNHLYYLQANQQYLQNKELIRQRL